MEDILRQSINKELEDFCNFVKRRLQLDSCNKSVSVALAKHKITSIEQTVPKKVVIDTKRCQCIARIWNTGLGAQCSRRTANPSKLCGLHNNRLRYGIITDEAPQVFEKHYISKKIQFSKPFYAHQDIIPKKK